MSLLKLQIKKEDENISDINIPEPGLCDTRRPALGIANPMLVIGNCVDMKA